MSRDKGDIASEQYTIEEDPGPWKFMAMFACEFASRSNETSQRKMQLVVVNENEVRTRINVLSSYPTCCLLLICPMGMSRIDIKSLSSCGKFDQIIIQSKVVHLNHIVVYYCNLLNITWESHYWILLKSFEYHMGLILEYGLTLFINFFFSITRNFI